MTRESVGIMIEFFNMTEGEFLAMMFLLPIAVLMWAMCALLTSMILAGTIDFWKKNFMTKEKKDDPK